MKKIILLFLVFFMCFLGQNTYANTKAEIRTQTIQKNEQRIKEINEQLKTTSKDSVTSKLLQEQRGLQSEIESIKSTAEREEKCAGSGDCIDQETFMIETGLFSVGGKELKAGTSTSKELINKGLGTIIQKLMIALGVISLLIMTIGAGYIILYRGEDEYLTKGKGIFTAGIISLVIALSSYYIVNIVAYILYK